MKKFLKSIILVGVMALGLVSCGKEEVDLQKPWEYINKVNINLDGPEALDFIGEYTVFKTTKTLKDDISESNSTSEELETILESAEENSLDYSGSINSENGETSEVTNESSESVSEIIESSSSLEEENSESSSNNEPIYTTKTEKVMYGNGVFACRRDELATQVNVSTKNEEDKFVEDSFRLIAIKSEVDSKYHQYLRAGNNESLEDNIVEKTDNEELIGKTRDLFENAFEWIMPVEGETEIGEDFKRNIINYKATIPYTKRVNLKSLVIPGEDELPDLELELNIIMVISRDFSSQGFRIMLLNIDTEIAINELESYKINLQTDFSYALSSSKAMTDIVKII